MTWEQHLGIGWLNLLKEELEKVYLKHLLGILKKEYETQIIFPAKEDVFAAFRLAQPNDVKVVIIGQDPYHTPKVAHGLAFSTKEETTPPSLRNIFKEIEQDVGNGLIVNNSNDLTYLANQGVFLLNTVLTVRKNQPFSHSGFGWEVFTENVVNVLTKNYKNIVFLLWGSNAHKIEQHIDKNNGHYVLKAAHPSPFSAYRGFFGCKHFSKTNEILKLLEKEEIKWI